MWPQNRDEAPRPRGHPCVTFSPCGDAAAAQFDVGLNLFPGVLLPEPSVSHFLQETIHSVSPASWSWTWSVLLSSGVQSKILICSCSPNWAFHQSQKSCFSAGTSCSSRLSSSSSSCLHLPLLTPVFSLPSESLSLEAAEMFVNYDILLLIISSSPSTLNFRIIPFFSWWTVLILLLRQLAACYMMTSTFNQS